MIVCHWSFTDHVSLCPVNGLLYLFCIISSCDWMFLFNVSVYCSNIHRFEILWYWDTQSEPMSRTRIKLCLGFCSQLVVFDVCPFLKLKSSKSLECAPLCTLHSSTCNVNREWNWVQLLWAYISWRTLETLLLALFPSPIVLFSPCRPTTPHYAALPLQLLVSDSDHYDHCSAGWLTGKLLTANYSLGLDCVINDIAYSFEWWEVLCCHTLRQILEHRLKFIIIVCLFFNSFVMQTMRGASHTIQF